MPAPAPLIVPAPPTARGRWLALAAALLGWMFDGFEMGLFPLVAGPALRDLLGPDAPRAEVDRWFAVITALFLLGAAAGGVLFGWLGDRVGRVRALTLSVLLYAGASGLTAFAAAPWQVASLRTLGALGMGGEWALGVALIMELWPAASRGRLAAAVGAAGNLGYAVVGAVALSLTAVDLDALGVPTALAGPGHWRLLMLLGVAPAGLTVLIRLFVPESPRWLAAGTTGRATPDLLRSLALALAALAAAAGLIAAWVVELPLAARLGVSAALLILLTAVGLAPARQLLDAHGASPVERRQTLGRMLLGAGLSSVPLLGTWAGIMWMYQWVGKLPGGDAPEARPLTQIASSLGAALGAALGALLADSFGRRRVYAGLCVGSAVVLLNFYRGERGFGPGFLASAALVGGWCAAFYGWLPLYLPELFRTPYRATGQGFAFNFGRAAAAVGTLQMPALLGAFDNDYARACSLLAVVYVAGLALIGFAPSLGKLRD